MLSSIYTIYQIIYVNIKFCIYKQCKMMRYVKTLLSLKILSDLIFGKR